MNASVHCWSHCSLLSQRLRLPNFNWVDWIGLDWILTRPVVSRSLSAFPPKPNSEKHAKPAGGSPWLGLGISPLTPHHPSSVVVFPCCLPSSRILISSWSPLTWYHLFLCLQFYFILFYWFSLKRCGQIKNKNKKNRTPIISWHHSHVISGIDLHSYLWSPSSSSPIGPPLFSPSPSINRIQSLFTVIHALLTEVKTHPSTT